MRDAIRFSPRHGCQLVSQQIQVNEPAATLIARVKPTGPRFRGTEPLPADLGFQYLPAGPGHSWELSAQRVTVGHPVGPMKDEYVPDGVPRSCDLQNVREDRFDPEGLRYISDALSCSA